MHILMIRPYLEAGGASRTILTLAGALQARGHQISLAAGGGSWLARARAQGIACFELPLAPSAPYNLLWSARGLRAIVRQRAVDLVHSHHRFAGLAARLALIGLDIPLVTTVHEFNGDRPWLTRLGAGQQVMTYSQGLQQHLVDHFQLPPGRISVIAPGIAPATAAGRRPAGGDRPVIGCLARLAPEKGIDILLLALAHLQRTTDHRPHCLIAGDGPLLSDLERQAAALDLASFVTFLRWQDNIITFIDQIEFLVLPSRTEGFGLVVLEGWRQGRPTIGTRVGGLVELIYDGEDGLLVPADDPVALAGAIARLLDNPALAAQLGRSGQRQKLPNFTVEQMVRQSEAIYQKCFNANEEPAETRS